MKTHSLIVGAVLAGGAWAAPAQLTLNEIGGGPLSPNLGTAMGTVAFGRDEIGGGGLPQHKIPNIRDGIYGNGNSWIGDSPNSFIGLNFGATPVPVGRVAWGRDNTAGFGDRAAGPFTLQYTTVPNPDALTPDASWTTLGVVNYPFQGVPGSAISMSLRHVWSFASVNATGIRLIVPGSSFGDGGCIDELEASSYAAPALALRQVGGPIKPGNLATAAGATAFAKDVIFGGTLPSHQIAHLRDGVAGNANSWIGDSESSFAGIAFGGSRLINRVAFGRDNTGAFGDRAQGNYLIQYTTVPAPGASTPDASWITLGAVFHDPSDPAKHLRHEYEFALVAATGLRIITPGNGAGSGTCLDEIEVYGASLTLNELGGGPFAANYAVAPGSTAFGRDEIGGGTLPIHKIPNIRDGVYGNNNSWIGDSLNSFVGVSFGATAVSLGRVAWGRDNTGVQGTRAVGNYRLEFTTVPNPDAATPDTAWTLLGTVTYESEGVPGTLNSLALRHAWSFPAVMATGIRLTAPGNSFADGACVDELEAAAYAAPPLTLTRTGGTMMRAANIARRGTAFAKDTIFGASLPSHQVAGLNDGIYGNANSWIGDSAGSFCGIAFGGSRTIGRVAFGRDNTGMFNDRASGGYLLQYTTVPTPDGTTPDASWTTIGPVFQAGTEPERGLRHEYSFAPVTATAIRLVVPGVDVGSFACIDELEVYLAPATLVQSGGTFAPGNVAPDGTAFGRDELRFEPPAMPGVFIHLIGDINDGVYGNDDSWIGNSEESFVGVSFTTPRRVRRVAFSRDNTGFFSDRVPGRYQLQYTTVPGPDAATPDAQWRDLGTVYLEGVPAVEALRKVYEFPTVAATGVRIVAPGNGVPSGACLDEIEIYEENQTPVALPNGLATMRDQPSSVPLIKLLANDSDPDGDPLSVTSVSSASQQGGTVVLAAGQLNYAPPVGFTGLDQFSYTVKDGHGGSATAVVEVLVVSGTIPAPNQVSLAPVGNGYRVRFAGIPGRAYEVQRASSLSGPWSTLAPITAPLHGILEYLDPNPPPGMAFYRTVAP